MEVLLDEFSFFIILQATIVPSFSVYIFRLAFFSHLLGLPFDQIFFLNIYEATVAQLSLLLNLQVGRDDFKLNVKLQLFALVAKQPTFHQLRSVEQLGYITVLMQRYVDLQHHLCSQLERLRFVFNCNFKHVQELLWYTWTTVYYPIHSKGITIFLFGIWN